MRIVFIVFLSLIIILASCASQDDPNEIDPEINLPIVEKDQYRIVIYNKNSQNLSNDAWLDTIKREYGIELMPEPQKINDSIASVYSAYRSGSSALVYLFNEEFVEAFSEIKHMIVPLDSSLSNNETWHALPDKYKNNGMLEQSLWGIPLQYNEHGSSENIRLYQSTLLESLNINPPENTASFYEYLLLAKESNLCDYFMHITRTSPFYDMGDIFASYGIKSDYHATTIYSISYDQVKNRYLETATTPNMRNALDYVKQLHVSGLIDISDTRSYPTESFYQGKTATVINSLVQIIKNRKTALDYSLGFESDDHKIYVQQSKGLYVFVNNQENSSRCLSKMIDEFLKNSTTNITAFIGDESTYSKITDNIILYNGSIVNDAPYLFGNILIPQKVISRKSITNENSQFSERELEDYSSILYDFRIKADEWDFLPLPLEDLALRTKTEYSGLFQSFAGEIYENNVSIDDILERYSITMERIGGYDYLESLNSRLNN